MVTIFRRPSDGFEVQDAKGRGLAWVTQTFGEGFVEVIPDVEPAEKRGLRIEIDKIKAELANSDVKILKKLEKLLPNDDTDVVAREQMRVRVRQIETDLSN